MHPTTRYALIATLTACLALPACDGPGGDPPPATGPRLRTETLTTGTGGGTVTLRSYRDGVPVIVQVAGASYNSCTYFNALGTAPGPGGRGVSQTTALLAAGYAVACLDLPGTGQAYNPVLNGDTLEMQVMIEAVRHTCNGLRGRFPTLYLVGHSFGALVAARAQGTYHPANGLVVQGFTDVAHPVPGATAEEIQNHISTGTGPVRTDGSGGGGYMSPYPPGKAHLLFFRSTTTNDDLLAYQDKIADRIPRTWFVQGFQVFTFGPSVVESNKIEGQMLLQQSRADVIMPVGGFAVDVPATITRKTYDDLGHSFELHEDGVVAPVHNDLIAWLASMQAQGAR